MTMYASLIFLLVALGLNAVDADCKFECVSEKEFKYNGMTFPCGTIGEESTVCNENYCDEDSNGLFCDTIKNVCDYKCVPGEGNENKIIVGGAENKCPDNTICNVKGDSCENMCITTCTNAGKYECISDTTFVISGITLSCGEGQICNQKLEQSCDICIPSGTTSKPTEPAEPTEEPTDEHTEEPNEKPTEEPNEEPTEELTEEPTTQKEEIPTEKETIPTTTELITTPTTPPPEVTTPTTTPKEVTTPTTTGTTAFPIPNCNNPSGSVSPCRYGPKGYYYKCVKVNSSSYAARRISCAAWPYDNICNRYRLC
ncbi:salivary glue protein Sgs-3-like [Atheta coriaria]|uniref:salivary glue protein Sgs-3-like n=1 Tax=Dalotia coriaria TaxID=877792 RepID=UPI0031F41E68